MCHKAYSGMGVYTQVGVSRESTKCSWNSMECYMQHKIGIKSLNKQIYLMWCCCRLMTELNKLC